MRLQDDPDQERVLAHPAGPLLVTGPSGTGKTAVLRERFARLIEDGADPDRVVLVVGSSRARAEARAALFDRLRASLPSLRVTTVHGLAYDVVTRRFGVLGYPAAPTVLSAADQFAKVQDLLQGEDRGAWPTYGAMLGLRGFADQVRQFLLRAQEALLPPEVAAKKAETSGVTGWRELAAFYRRYLDVLDAENTLDFAGLVEQASGAVEGQPSFYDHVLVDDYQDSTLAAEALILGLAPQSLVVAGDPDGHVFSFQGSTDVPLRRFAERVPGTARVSLATRHRGPDVRLEAWLTPHVSEEYGAVVRELRRVHVEEDVPWSRLAVVVRRHGSHVGGLLRALDDGGIPRFAPERGLSLLAEPSTYPFVLALRWIARPEQRDALIEPLLTSELARLAPAAARGLVRSARTAGEPAGGALAHTAGLPSEQAESVASLRTVLQDAEAKAAGSVLDAFGVLWRGLPYARRLVERAEGDPESRRMLDAVVAFAGAVAAAGVSADPGIEAFLEGIEAGEEGPGHGAGGGREPEAVRVLTAHGSVGREVDTVIVVGALEGNFPSLSRPEPMFDLAALEGRVSQSDRNRLRLADERGLFRVVVGRAARRVVFTASTAHDDPELTARSRLVDELGVGWQALPEGPSADPLTAGEAAAWWRRTLADPRGAAPDRLAALDGLLALGADPARWWFQRDWTDTGRPLHDRVRVSFSRLGTLENCELQYVLSEELGLGGASGYHAWVGQLVHRLIEEYEQGEIPRSLESLVQAADDRWRQEEFPSYAVSEAFRRLVARKMLPNWFREYERNPSLAREVRFEFEFDGATVTGYIDRIGPIIAGGNRITDYKTGKSDNAGKPEENLQLGIYYLAVDEAPELAPYRPVRAVELAFLRGKWNEPDRVARVGFMPSGGNVAAYGEGMRERLGGLIGRIRTLMQTEAYRPSPAADCHFCQFKTLCPLWPEGSPLFSEIEGRSRR
jgi:superfamily I DNA/RNA helicase